MTLRTIETSIYHHNIYESNTSNDLEIMSYSPGGREGGGVVLKYEIGSMCRTGFKNAGGTQMRCSKAEHRQQLQREGQHK